MIIIKHRVNTIEELRKTPNNLGVEIDLRSFKDKIIIHHEPCIDGVSFDEWIKHYKHNFLILNVKEEGLENSIMKIINSYEVKNFFFLDQSFPLLIKTVLSGEPRTAIRISKYESLETAINFKNLAKWVWIDYFENFPLNDVGLKKLKEANFNLCLVSPELQGFSYEKTVAMKNELLNKNFLFNAVCTKFPDLWGEKI